LKPSKVPIKAADLFLYRFYPPGVEAWQDSLFREGTLKWGNTFISARQKMAGWLPERKN
jgi:hypothetical protein